MSPSQSLTSLAASGAAAFALAAFIVISPEFAFAADPKAAPASPPQQDTSKGGTCTCPSESSPWVRPKFAGLEPRLNDDDHLAALESVQYALTETADGATYVWHRHHGRLSGLVQPTSSFKDSSGHVCRHIIVMLSSAQASRKTEGIACRMDGGIWRLEG